MSWTLCPREWWAFASVGDGVVHVCPPASPACPGVVPQLPGTSRGCWGSRPWVPEGLNGLRAQLPQRQRCRERVFPSLLRDFPGISAPVRRLSKGNSRQTPVPLPALAERGKKSCPSPFPGRGVRASLSSLRIIIFQQNFLSHLSVFLQLKQFLLPNFQHLEFGFSLLKKKKFKIHSLDETPSPLYLPAVFSFNFVSVANARSPKELHIQ